MSIGSVSEDVFQHHDGVIHNHTHTHGHAAQTHHVQGDVQHLHQQEHRHDTKGHRHRNDQRGAPVPQEHEQHQCRQQHAQNDIADGAIDGQIDIVALVHQHGPVQRRVLRRDLLDSLLHTLGSGRGVYIGLLVDGQNHAVLSVHAGNGGALLGLKVYICHLAQPHTAAGAQGNQAVCHIFGRGKLSIRSDRERVRPVIHASGGNRHVLR